MKKLLLLAPLALLTACTTFSPPVPHLTRDGLTLTVHNPTKTDLTGNPNTGRAFITTVDGVNIRPAAGTDCWLAEEQVSGGVSWDCPLLVLKAGNKKDLAFEGDGAGPPVLNDAHGTGYLGRPIPVPIPLLPKLSP